MRDDTYHHLSDFRKHFSYQNIRHRISFEMKDDSCLTLLYRDSSHGYNEAWVDIIKPKPHEDKEFLGLRLRVRCHDTLEDIAINMLEYRPLRLYLENAPEHASNFVQDILTDLRAVGPIKIQDLSTGQVYPLYVYKLPMTVCE